MEENGFLSVIETLKQNEASVKRLFEGEGSRPRARKRSPKYNEHLMEAAKLVARVTKGSLPFHYFTEAMSTSDFPIYFGDIVDRQLLASYQEAKYTWRSFVKRALHRDFRSKKFLMFDGAEGPLERVHELEEYPEGELAESEMSYSIQKYGRRMPFSWESFINDDLELLRTMPQRFGKAARRTEDRFAVSLFVAASGPVDPFFSNGNNNLITNPLSLAGLQAGLTKFTDLKDVDGEPIVLEAAILVVPPALEVTANNILNAVQIDDASGGGAPGAANRIKVANWLKNKVTPVVNPYVGMLNTTNGATAWYLFASPEEGRPALQMGFLTGHETPEVFMKDPNARRVGGGDINPEEGDFDTDAIEYKVRHVLGGTRVDYKAAVASTGTG